MIPWFGEVASFTRAHNDMDIVFRYAKASPTLPGRISVSSVVLKPLADCAFCSNYTFCRGLFNFKLLDQITCVLFPFQFLYITQTFEDIN